MLKTAIRWRNRSAEDYREVSEKSRLQKQYKSMKIGGWGAEPPAWERGKWRRVRRCPNSSASASAATCRGPAEPLSRLCTQRQHEAPGDSRGAVFPTSYAHKHTSPRTPRANLPRSKPQGRGAAAPSRPPGAAARRGGAHSTPTLPWQQPPLPRPPPLAGSIRDPAAKAELTGRKSLARIRLVPGVRHASRHHSLGSDPRPAPVRLHFLPDPKALPCQKVRGFSPTDALEP